MLNSHKCGIFPAASPPPPSIPPIHTPSRPVAAARDAVIQHKNKTFYLSDQIFGGKIWESNYKWFNYNNIIRSPIIDVHNLGVRTFVSCHILNVKDEGRSGFLVDTLFFHIYL